MSTHITDDQILGEMRSAMRLLKKVENSLRDIATDKISEGTMRSYARTAVENLCAAYWHLGIIEDRVGRK
jgi:hypothetical protein